jgi:hypothetical protein
MPSEVYRGIYITPILTESAPSNSNIILEANKYDADIAGTILKGSTQGLHTLVKKLQEYSKGPEYYYGSPTVDYALFTRTIDIDLQNVITVIEGEDIQIDSANFAEGDEKFFAEERMLALYGYDLDTEVVSNPPFTVAADTVVTYLDADFIGGDLDISYSVQLIDASPPTVEVFTEPLTGFLLTNLYHMIVYHTLAAPTVFKYWIYNPSTGVYPELDNATVESTNLVDFLPVIPLRVEKHTLDNTDEGYASAVVAANLIGVDFDDVAASVSANPDIGDIEDASIQFGIDITTTNSVAIEYLWTTFYEMISFMDLRDEGGGFGTDTRGFYIRLTTVNFYYAISVAFVDEKIYSGTFTEATKIYGRNDSYTYTTNPSGPIPGLTAPSSQSTTGGFLIIRKQLTPNSYSELTVYGLRTVYAPDGSFSSTERNRAVTASTRDYGTDAYWPLFIPVNLTTLKRFSNSYIKRNDLLKVALMLEINTRTVSHLEWYETPGFIGLIQILGIALSVYTLQPELIAVSLAASVWVATALVLTLVVEIYLKGLVIEYLLDLFIKEFGLENTFIALAVAIVIAIASKSYDIISHAGLPWANELLAASTTFLNALGKPINDALSEIYKETGDFLETAKDRQEKIDEAQSLLGDGSIDPFDIIFQRSNIGFDETPDQYYERTIHNTNPGVASLSAIEHYVPNALRLPKT